LCLPPLPHTHARLNLGGQRQQPQVLRSSGLQRTKDLAVAQADLAIDALAALAPSPAKDALAHLAYKVVARKN